MKKYRVKFNAPVTLSFVLICLVVTVLGQLSGGTLTQALFMTYRGSYLNTMTYVRLFCHVFGHADLNHFAGNAAYLLLLGPLLEEKHGSENLAIVIAVTAVVTGFFSNMLFPDVALCGASGVVFAFILLSSLTGFKEHEIPMTFILVAFIFIGQQVAAGIFVRDNISNFAHIVGGIVGGAMGFSLNRNQI